MINGRLDVEDVACVDDMTTTRFFRLEGREKFSVRIDEGTMQTAQVCGPRGTKYCAGDLAFAAYQSPRCPQCPLSSTPDQMGDSKKSATRTQNQLTPVRESIVNKPPYISGKLQLPVFLTLVQGHQRRSRR
jgi:hypothetical protein